jgi:HTH-type transcriptional regulator / antitoxin HigA
MPAALDLEYEQLLVAHRPSVIRTKEENASALNALSGILSKGEENLSEAERKFLELLATLISDFERSAYQIPPASSADVLRELMRARGMKPRDLWGVFGSKGVVSEVLRGKRGISKERAKILAQMFGVSAELFI